MKIIINLDKTDISNFVIRQNMAFKFRKIIVNCYIIANRYMK